MEAKEVIARLCKLQEEVHSLIGYDSAADCFCGQGGFWDSVRYNGTHAGGYRNDGACLEFIEAAVREKIAHRNADQPSGVVLRNGDTMEFVSTNTEAGLTISDVKVTRAADQQEVQYCECAAPVPREPAGSSLPWCNTCGFDIQPDKT
jgi:hypothetical protein